MRIIYDSAFICNGVVFFASCQCVSVFGFKRVAMLEQLQKNIFTLATFKYRSQRVTLLYMLVFYRFKVSMGCVPIAMFMTN